MEMRLPAETIAHHLDHHQLWFQRCSAPMTARAMDDQTYVLTFSQFGNFGFEIKPTTALKLLLQKKNIDRIETVKMIPHSIDPHSHYDVDFEVTMRL